jgi:hypothetical protein
MREDPAVENAVVATTERDGVIEDLIGYVTLNEHQDGSADGTDDGDLRERLYTGLRRRLPRT